MRLIGNLQKGELPETLRINTRNEIISIINALHELIAGLKKIEGFSVEIGKGNFESSFTPLSNNDVLGNSLLELRKSLKAANDETHRRQKEDERLTWATHGEAKFAELLRYSKDFE